MKLWDSLLEKLRRLWDSLLEKLRRRERRLLTPAEGATDRELLIQASRKPVLYDKWQNGFDYVCGHCKRMVIASRIIDDQIWDLSFRCFRCQRTSLSPVLPPAKALPRCVVMDVGPAEIKDGIDLKGIVMVGQPAVDRRIHVAGAKGATFGYVPNRPPGPEGSAQYIEQVISDVRLLLGPTFDDLDKTDQKGLKSHTPPKRRHPLMVVVERLRTDIASFSTPSPGVHIECLMELRALLDTLARWQNHPYWPQLIHGLKQQNEYLHTVITIAAATFLEDTGNNIEFKETGPTRTPDLFLVVSLTERAAAEVKAPEVLRTPRAPLGYDRIEKLVRDCMKKAGTGSTGQLSRQQPSMLFIGGFNTWPADRADFKRAAEEHLRNATARDQHRHVMLIGLVSFGAITEVVGGKTIAKPALQVIPVKNPGYIGRIEVKTEMPPQPPPPSGDVT